MKKRVTTLLLIGCMLLTTAVPNIGYVFGAQEPAEADAEAQVTVQYDGEEITDILLAQSEKKTVTAVYKSSGKDCAYRWQTLIDLQSDLWVDITGQNGKSLELSYALLSSVLDESGGGYIRCAVTQGEETLYSKPVCATVSLAPELDFAPSLPERASIEQSAGRNQGLASRPQSQTAPKQTLPNKASQKSALWQNRAPLADPEPDPQADYAYITVNYIDAVSGKELFGSHISKIEKETTFGEIVHSPTFLGFAPYYYEADWDKAEIDTVKDDPENPNSKAKPAGTINFGELLKEGGALKPVEEDVTVNVYYWAIDVPYAVKYLFQNINDDYYTEQDDLYYVDKAKTGTIISDEELQKHAGNPEGFSPLYHYPESVAADGSTVFECYYDRNYHYIKFELGGGYGTDPIYARYDTPIVINNPTRHGYTFLGWDELKIKPDGTPGEGDGKPDTISSRIGTENKYYKALWEKADTTYTVIYWLQNAEPIPDWEPNDLGIPEYDYSYLGYNVYPAKAEEEKEVNTGLSDAIGVQDNPERLAQLRFLELNESRSETSVYIKGDGSTVVNVYYDRKDYTLKYYYAREYTNRGTVHHQICGNTSEFSDHDITGNGTKDISTLLSYCNSTWSDVTAIPTLKNDNGHYQAGTEPIRHNNTDYTYYYFTITGKYGCDLTDEWPIEALQPATLVNARNGTTNAYFGAWNPEHHLYYGQHAAEDFNGNRTVKGLFQKLDKRILYDERFREDSNDGEVRFLAFWTNSCPGVTWDKTRKWVYNVHLEKLDGNMPNTPTSTITTYDTNDEPGEQTPPSIVGFSLDEERTKANTNTGQTFDNGNKVHTIDLYYTRTKYKLELYNRTQHWGEAQIPFEMNVGELLMNDIEKAIPKYPDALEEKAYFFEGWYTTADCADGSGFIRRDTPDGPWRKGYAYFNQMDAHDLILYANWQPLKHQVKFFKTYQDILNYDKSGDDEYIFNTTTDGQQHDKVFKIDHGNVVGTIDFPTREEDGQEFEFKGWFYINNGVKTMFTPADTPIKKDMEVFAEWGSRIPQPYRIQYMKYGTDEKVADDTFGYAYQGSTRTFVPKAGGNLNQLYEDYNTGWYPIVESHSITIEAETDKDNPTENIYTFYYVKLDELPYTVRYVDKQTGKPLITNPDDPNDKGEVVRNNDNPMLSVVTERFKPFEGYVPDAFYKRMVLSVKWDENDQPSKDPADNVITFYYTKTDTTAFYAVHHMLQKPGTSGENSEDYAESDLHTEGTVDIDPKTEKGEMKVQPTKLAGYIAQNDAVVVHGGDNSQSEHTYLDQDNVFTFEVKREGTEIFIYYKLKKYDYTVQYLEHGTNEEVDKPKTVKDKEYGTVVTEQAIDVDGWTAIDPTTKSLTIRDYDPGSDEDDPNVITFYYVKESYIAEYKVVGGGGTLDNYGGTAMAGDEFKGSAPIPDEGFAFDGWYTDEACTNPVNENWVNKVDNRMIPQVGDELKPAPTVNIYYAKFRETTGDLTIKRSNAADEGNGNQVFVYKVTHNADPSLTIYVSITGEGEKTIHDLRCGTYTVEQIHDWSWRYADQVQTDVEVKESPGNAPAEATFGEAAKEPQWLNGNSPVAKNVRGKGA